MTRKMAVLALSLAGCTTADLTEIVVEVEAEPAVQAKSLSIQVTSDPYGAPVELENSSASFNGRFTISLAPEDDRNAGLYRLVVSALKDGQPIATARLISGYVKGETRYVNLLLENSCINVHCTADTTCQAGQCVSARANEWSFAEDQETARMRRRPDGGAPRDAGPYDAGSGWGARALANPLAGSVDAGVRQEELLE